MLATILAAISPLEQILCREDDIPFCGVVKIVRLKLRTVVIGIHGAHAAQRNNRKGIEFATGQ